MSSPHGKKPQIFLVLVRTDKARALELGRRFQVSSDSIYLGNTNEADVPLGLGWNEPCRVHIFYTAPSWYVKDQEYFNHVSVNGVCCQKFQINDGDLIQVRDFAFEVSFSGGIKSDFFEENERARQQDLLTKAYNRGYLDSIVNWEIERHKKASIGRRKTRSTSMAPMSLIMFDIDHFGAFNKLHDHQVGDEVLKGVVERVKARVRSTDIVARWGGEEFMVYLPETELEQATEVAEQIRKQVGDTPYRIDQKDLRVTISLGVAQYEADMDMQEFIRKVNLNMLDAKKQGRNRVVS